MGTRQVITLTSILALPVSLLAEDQSARFELANIDDFIEARKASLLLNERTFDPFGTPLDPNKKVEEKTPERTITIQPKTQRILIENEIARLAKKANIVGRSMIIEGQPYFRGDTIKVSVKGKTFPLKVTSITRSRVTFYDADDKNLISLDMDNLPDLPLGSDQEIDLEGNTKTHDLNQ
ncbi:hypothetical protein ACFPK9_04860 [Rubritalea spongiae]|uniref:Organic solvent tolerance-like N-terminal domain-containing protein n=1 Tax=Rubritalea spongiae TaxID=430797 RepID=A0ABW5E5M6_9BACT